MASEFSGAPARQERTRHNSSPSRVVMPPCFMMALIEPPQVLVQAHAPGDAIHDNSGVVNFS